MDRIYQLKITFNEASIEKIVITDYYLQKHGKVINDDLILKLIENKLNNKIVRPDLKYLKREVFV